MDRLRQDVKIGRNMRTLRNAAKLTQEQVVARLQLEGSKTTRPIYSRYETGELNIKISDLILLKTIFNCPYEDFFAVEENQ